MRYIFAAAAVLLVLAPASPATGLDTIGIYSDQVGTGYDIDPPPFVPFTAYVVVQGDALTGAAFSVSMPDGGPNLIVLDPVVLSGFLFIGDVYSGLEVAFGGCLVAPVAVVALNFFLAGPIEGCGELRVLPHPAIGAIQIVDCGFVTRTAGGGNCQCAARWYLGDDVACAVPAPPSDPYPADGATGVSIDVVLDCTVHEPRYCPGILYGSTVAVYFGTSPDPPHVPNAGLPYDPGNLQPETTYYWRVNRDGVSSPVWSFTTIDARGRRSQAHGARSRRCTGDVHRCCWYSH